MATEEKLQLDRINNNVQSTLRTIAETGVSVAANANSDALPAAAAALANEKQDKLTGTAGQVVGFDANGNAVAQEAPSGGGATWAGLPDKPVVMAGGDTLTWDGNTEGKADFIGVYWLVSESTPAITDFSNGCVIEAGPIGTLEVPAAEIVEYATNVVAIMLDGEPMVFVVAADNTVVGDAGFLYKGIYLFGTDGFYVSCLTIPGYTGFVQEKIAPSHLWQPDWNQNDPNAADFFKNKPFGEMDVIAIQEQDVAFDENGEGMVAVEAVPAVGSDATVEWDGVIYNRKVSEFNSWSYVGNMLAVGDEDTGEPFLIVFTSDSAAMVVSVDMEKTNARVKVAGKGTAKIDPKYVSAVTKFYINDFAESTDINVYTDVTLTTKATAKQFAKATESGEVQLVMAGILHLPVIGFVNYGSMCMAYVFDIEGSDVPVRSYLVQEEMQ